MRPLVLRNVQIQGESTPRLLRISLNGMLVGLWLYFYHPIFPYLATIFGRQEFRTNQILLAGILLLVFLRMRKREVHISVDQLPQFYPPAFLLTLTASAAFLVSEQIFNIHTLSAGLFGLGTYGLLGLWLRKDTWKTDFPAALLLIGALPFGEHMQTFVGYPVRLMTAEVVRGGLSALGMRPIGIDTILVFENSLSKVDLPCSGVKSLWTGSLFLLAATWIERRQINLRWLMLAIVFFTLLLAANLMRVGVLILVGQVAGWRLLAEMLHVPLGVIGFVGACAAAVILLRRQTAVPFNEKAVVSPELFARPIWLPVLLAVLLLAMTLIYTPSPQPALALSVSTMQFPPEINAEHWPLPEQILNWLNLDGPVSADRWRFNRRGETGSILIVASNDWRNSHHPERCFQAYGMTLQGQIAYLVNPDFPVNLLVLQLPQTSETITSIYWLQSRDIVTEDYAKRVWSEIFPNHPTWVQVIILFDRKADVHSSATVSFLNSLRQAIQHSLEGGSSP